ncbi:hypothetical protein [Leucobacter sp. G161]|uniref:hypothetical protein n=1 Tax=Leucobacter sp. G161 TaxID=663704 RepID=UPI00073CED6C|nr:hypothetical protein [Leucobacter sp. G161]KUF05537.1 hypothetical protein AUL38_04065 [Leucobacter sp. G161]
MSTENKTPKGAAHVGTGLVLGLALGAAFGAGSENPAAILAIGMAVGIIGGYGAMLLTNRKK